jgi:GNAT superfamily N-acetyltransferase
MPAKMAPWFAHLAARPAWRAVAAIDQDRIVGGGLVHLQDRFAWLGAGGVRPEARGRRAHRALMALRIRLAIEAGRTRITTETGEPVGDEPNPSLRNMAACGFTKVFARLNFAAPA